MNLRICTNPDCRVIQPAPACPLCNTETRGLPSIFLTTIGIDGAARLDHTTERGYSLCLSTPSGFRYLQVPIRDLVQSGQAHLPGLNEAPGLAIMDVLNNAVALLQSKNSGHWAGWIIYLVEQLQGHTTPITHQEMLRDLWQEISSRLVENALSSEEA